MEILKTLTESEMRLHRIHHGMMRRCYSIKDKGYVNYGGRGIGIYQEWVDSTKAFKEWSFLNGYKDNLSIDRIDNDGNYEPSNCRWATTRMQSNNKRDCVYITISGLTLTLTQWAEKVGISRITVNGRIATGWTPEKAVMTPVKSWKTFLEYKGEIKQLCEWVKILGIKRTTLGQRVRERGMTLKEAVNTPVVSPKPKNTNMTDEIALRVKESLERGVPRREIVDRYGITMSIVGMIALGKRWSHITGIDYCPVRRKDLGLLHLETNTKHKNVNAAAKESGRSRRTIQKYLDAGELIKIGFTQIS